MASMSLPVVYVKPEKDRDYGFYAIGANHVRRLVTGSTREGTARAARELWRDYWETEVEIVHLNRYGKVINAIDALSDAVAERGRK